MGDEFKLDQKLFHVEYYKKNTGGNVFLGCLLGSAGCKHPINFAISLARSLRNHQFVENRYANFFFECLFKGI